MGTPTDHDAEHLAALAAGFQSLARGARRHFRRTGEHIRVNTPASALSGWV